MKRSLCQTIAIVCILAVGFTTVSLFVLKTDAHDNSSECDGLQQMCSGAYTLVIYYCYSGEVYDPELCNTAWSIMGSACAAASTACSHDINEDH